MTNIYAVTTRTDHVQIEAHRVVLDIATLSFERDGEIIAAFAAGAWEHFVRLRRPSPADAEPPKAQEAA